LVDALDSGSSVCKDFRVQVPGSAFWLMLTSLQNPLVKQIRKLHTAKYRRQEGLFLLEGTHLIEEAAFAKWPMKVLCFTAAWQAKESALLETLQTQGIRCELVSPEVLLSMATTINPDGVVALARSHSKPNHTLFSIQSLGLVLETLQDPGNVGTILRTAAAAGVEGIWLDRESVDLESPKVLRASAGAWFRVPTAHSPDLPAQVRDYQTQGFQVVATTPKADLDYWAVDYTQPTLVLVGNEGAGLSDALIAAATLQVSIPLSAGIESLNAAIATAVILYEAKRQRSPMMRIRP
jgi:RNA methyltransferase, TrmH family